jgi:hypothetical protein
MMLHHPVDEPVSLPRALICIVVDQEIRRLQRGRDQRVLHRE